MLVERRRQAPPKYGHLLAYVVLRNTQHHFADEIPWGWLVPALGLVPLASPRVRLVAIALWAQVLGWLALAALNGQARWQNERVTMPAVAWLMLLAALGLATLVSRAAWIEGPLSRLAVTLRFERTAWLGRVSVAALVVAAFWAHQAPNMRFETWFFGRASRNVRDQHIVTGEKLRRYGATKVLVGDAGAIVYAADIAGLDLIGLGGYHDLPFARASGLGVGATLELLEHVPPRDRPDSMALYPSWWGDLPGLFGKRVDSTPIAGNVICGDFEDVIYKADFAALDPSGMPRSLLEGERVVDELDVGDLVSERTHDYALGRGALGFVDYRVLPVSTDARAADWVTGDPHPTGDSEGARDRTRDLFDAGRVIPMGGEESATMRAPEGPARLALRTIVARSLYVDVLEDDRVVGRLAVSRTHTWTEPSIPCPRRPAPCA